MTEAAEQENAWARLDLALYYANGVGTDPDQLEAAFWIARAYSLSDEAVEETARKRLVQLPRDAVIDAAGRLQAQLGYPDLDETTLNRRLESAGASQQDIVDPFERLLLISRLPVNQ